MASNVNDKLDPSIVITSQPSNPWTVEKALDCSPIGKPVEGSNSPIPYFHILERLKTTKRAGWRRFGINQGESIADHMFRMSLMVMAAPPSIASRLDLNKCMKMCLLHDLAESLVGDVTPADGVPKPEKNRREAETMDYISQKLLGNVYGGKTSVAQDVKAIWLEHEDGITPESKFFQDLDKVELLLQMIEYEKRGEGKVILGEFTYVATKVVLPEVKIWVDEILQERDEFWRGKNEDIAAPDEMKKFQDQYYDK